MSRLKVRFLVAVVLLFGAYPAFATNVEVGTCKSGLTSFPTISAAVAAVPPGSTVEVCPGTYAEQVTITKSLRLVGVISGNSSRAVIAVPPSGLTVVTDSMGLSIAAMVSVTAGNVQIAGITVDGSGNTVDVTGGNTYLVGIYYANGSEGSVEESTARQMVTGTNVGVGIMAENESGVEESVIITKNSIHDFDGWGILVYSDQTSGPYVDIVGNTILANTNYAPVGIFWSGGNGDKISGNVITSTYGLGRDISLGNAFSSSGHSVTISDNTLTHFGLALDMTMLVPVPPSTVIVQSNRISDSTSLGIGILIDPGNVLTLRDNTIMDVGTGIFSNCASFSASMSNNIVNDAGVGVNNPPMPFISGVNFDNVDTVVTTGGCVAPLTKGVPGRKTNRPEMDVP